MGTGPHRCLSTNPTRRDYAVVETESFIGGRADTAERPDWRVSGSARSNAGKPQSAQARAYARLGKKETTMQENDAGAAVREVERIVRGSPIKDGAWQPAPRLNGPMARVDVAAVVGRIRTPESAAEYRELEASTLALQTKADQQLAILRGLERGNAPEREVAAAGRILGNTEYAYDFACWRLRMQALSALMGPTSPISHLSWPEKIAIGFREDRTLGDYTDEDIAAIAANVEARLSEPST